MTESAGIVCAALALAWAAGGRGSLPALEPPPVGCPDDGWIFYPSGSEWSREGRDQQLLEPRT
jgi:hypothetical protein